MTVEDVDARTILLVRLLAVAVARELGRRSQERGTEPGRVPLLLVRDDVDVEARGL
jgi:hypothetical protein